MKKFILAPLVAVGLMLTALTGVAFGHTPGIDASCAGVHLTATAYDSGQQNHWSVTINGVEEHGTFGDALDQTFPVPQGGATTTWSAHIEAYDGGYPGDGSGTVGPCGTPPVDVCPDIPGDQPAGTDCTPPVVHKRAAFSVRSYCNGVFLETKRHAAVTKTKVGAGVFRFVGKAKHGALFGNGTDTRTIVRHVKHGGSCGGSSS